MNNTATENNVFEAILFKNGKSQIKGRNALTLSFVSKAYDDEDRYYDLQADYGESLEEWGLSLPQFLAIDAPELELRGRKQVDDEMVVEKHIGWIRWHKTEDEARQWIEEKVKKNKEITHAKLPRLIR